jgi:AcrR family transcriptional regulator
MVSAATALFTSSGFAGTTMEDGAKASSMSVQSVYFAFHHKAALLQAALDAAVAALPPSGVPTSVAGDPEGTLAALVEHACAGLTTTGPLALAAAAGAPGDPGVAEVLARVERRRSEAATALVQRLRTERPLARGVTPRRVSDVVYGVLSPELHELLVGRRGWTRRRFAGWAAGTIARALWG